jgi:hypothetical protein
MTKTSSTVYTYAYTAGAGDGAATVALSTGTDVAGNVITSAPTSGATFTVDNTAPTNQDAVFAASVTKYGGVSVTIVSSGDATNSVWFAPSGTTNFVAGATMTKAVSGTATTILAPANVGTYYLFVIDAAGNISNASAATLTVTILAITANADSGGSITPSGSVSVNNGSDQSFTIAADSGYTITNVEVDGVSQGPITSYTFHNVTAAHLISANFRLSAATTTSTGNVTVAASSTNVIVNGTATANTTITVSTTGAASVNITIEQYSSNPHPEATLPADMLTTHYTDITVSNNNSIVWPMYVKETYTDADVAGIDESSLGLYYFQGTSWHRC